MRWDCPHCKTSLQTPALTLGADLPGPQPGWAYVRCFQCDEFAAVDLATGQAEALSHSHKKKSAMPPPFRHAQVLAPAPNPKQDTSPSTPEPIRILSDLAEPPLDFPDSPPPLPFVAPRKNGQATIIKSAGFAILAVGVAMLWLGQKSVDTSPHVSGEASIDRLERAHVAAQRVTSAQVLASNSPDNGANNRVNSAANNSEMSDSIHSSAMAPRRPKPEEIQLYLQARKTTRSMELRTGPGTEYPLFGLADLDERYPVVEIKNRWFRIQLEETPGLTAWVPYERAELFSADQENGVLE